MTYLVDSDRVVDWLSGRPDVHALFAKLANEGLFISIVTYAEVYEGIYYGSDPPEKERVFRTLLRTTRVLGLSQPIGRLFATLSGDLRRRGQRIPMADTLIAATAIHHDLMVLTRNRRHFGRFPDIRFGPES